VGLIILWAPFLKADWMNLTGAETAQNIAEIYVLDDHIKVKLEVYVGDLDKFEELIPDEWTKESPDKRLLLEERMQIFANERLQFIADKGMALPARLVLVEPRMRVDRESVFAGMINPMTQQRVKSAPDDKRVLYAEIIYPFDQKPKQLTIIPPLDDQGVVMANIGFLAYHKAVPIIDFRYLGQPVTLNLDWQDPWYSKFENKNLTRHHKYPLMLYLYVEPRQIRLESLLRFRDIAELTDFNTEYSHVSIEDKYQLLREHIKDYYDDKETLKIDGDLFNPDSIRVEFLNATLSGLKVIDIEKVVDESSLLVGISQQYLIEALPQKIDAKWQFFNQRIDRIPVIVTDPVGPLQTLVNKEDPEFSWQNFLKQYSEPVIQPIVVETGLNFNLPFVGETKIVNQLPDQLQTLSIVDGVLKNIRVAFIEKDPNNFSRALGEVISSKQTVSIEKELAKLFSPKVTGRAVGAVQEFNNVQVVNIRELANPDAFSATISGSAIISAQHWGHTDRRQVVFQLLIDLIEENKQWRLADLTVVDIKETK
jgi:hypothetical protein